MPKDGEVSEDADAGSIGSFEDLRAYFDQKLSTKSLVKELESETNVTFKFSGNRKQFELNTETFEYVCQSLVFV